MADRLIQYGMGDSRFLFSAYPKLYQLKLSPERFDDMQFNSMALPGLDGVFPTNYMSRGRATSTEIALQFKYAGNDATDFTAFKKALHQMKNHGLSYLFKTLEDGTLVFTLAACTRVNVQSDNDSQAHVFPTGELRFFCPKARWYGKEGIMFLDNGDALDDTLTLVGPQIDRVTVYNGDTVELTNNGDAPAGVYIWFEAPAGETVENPSLSRLSVDGVSLADEIEYEAVLSGGDVVILDARNHEAQLNYAVLAASGYGNVNALRATWLEIPPGTHELTVGGTFSDGMILTLDLWDTYY
jgi:hypothetical protein